MTNSWVQMILLKLGLPEYFISKPMQRIRKLLIPLLIPVPEIMFAEPKHGLSAGLATAVTNFTK